MNDDDHLRPATASEIADSLSFALRYDGRKRVHHADDVMARITADRLVKHLKRSGFVVMKRPGRARAVDQRARTRRRLIARRCPATRSSRSRPTTPSCGAPRMWRSCSRRPGCLASRRLASSTTARWPASRAPTYAPRRAGVRLVVGCRLDLSDGAALLVYPTDRAAYSRLCRLLTLGKGRAGKGGCDLGWQDLVRRGRPAGRPGCRRRRGRIGGTSGAAAA